jgi:signal transduction histidine kinase
MADDALAQARAMLSELTEAARKGQIIPARLTGQLEAVLDMMDKAQEKKTSGEGASGEAETVRTELAGILSHGFHDLRLPLTNIRGYSDMLANPAMGELNAMHHQFVDIIRANSRRMEALLTDVSDMSKIWGKTLKVSMTMDMFKNIAQKIEKNMRPLADELGRTLEFDIPQGLPLLNLDGELFTKALDKLVENALRYTLPEGGKVKVSAVGDGGKLRVTIHDNGIGMTPEELAQLGTPYFRADHEHVLNFKGSGLGIPIAYGIVALLGGTVSVTSQPNQGTEFTITVSGMS